MKKYTQEELCLIWLDSFIGLEYKHKQQLYKYIEGKANIKALIEGCKDYIMSNVGEKEYNTLLTSANKVYLDYVLDGLNARQINAITIYSEAYPEKLLNTEIPPLVLYAQGDERLLTEQSFAIVGSRRSLPNQLAHAKFFAESISSAGFTIVTGIAEGVDSAVINATLDKNGKVISVIAGGIDNVYPSANKKLVERIAKTGLVISEHPPEVVPKPYHFPVRNRIIAGLSDGTLVVSGDIKSGTIYTAEYAEEYGRQVFAIPYNIGIESGAGCNELIKRGAVLVDSPDDVLNFFGKNLDALAVEITDEERDVLSVLSNGSKHVEQISKELDCSVFKVSATISMLEIKGLIVKDGYNIYGLKR